MTHEDYVENWDAVVKYLYSQNDVKWQTCNWGTGFIYDNKGDNRTICARTTIDELKDIIEEVKQINIKNPVPKIAYML